MVESTIPTLQWLRNKIEQLDTDLLREIVQSVAELLMSYDADSRCNAAYGQKSAERTNHRNGYRRRRWDTRVGSIDLAIPRLRQGSYFLNWLLRPRRRYAGRQQPLFPLSSALRSTVVSIILVCGRSPVVF